MDPTKKLVIPEINGNVIEEGDRIIANPNCSTIQMLVAIAGLHRRFGIKRIVVSTYQCITGTGKKAVDQMSAERDGKESPLNAYPYRIDLNLLPHIDVFMDNGYTKEEMKMVNETIKIMGDESIKVSPTTVRDPVLGGHAESINLEFTKPFEMEEIFETLRNTPGVVVQDAVKLENGAQPGAIGSTENLPYPMPLFTKDRDEVFVGRIRRDFSLENGINLWCVADNLRKGAATNAVQIAELLKEKGLV
jgi:aspartate-semialdehyde dehydrogenase